MKITKLFILSILAVLFAGCSQFSAPAIYSSKAMNELTTDLKKIGENYKIEKVRVYEKETLSNEFGMAIVEMRDSEGQKYEQSLYYNLSIPHDDPKPMKERGIKRQEPHAVNIDDIINQKDNIEKYVEEAKAQIDEEFESKCKFESVTFLTFTADNEGNLQIQFTVNITEKGKSDRREGGRMVTDYYGLEFSVDNDGNVTYNGD